MKVGEVMTVDEQLKKLADEEGETSIGPDTDNEQDLKSFQADVRRLEALASEGVI